MKGFDNSQIRAAQPLYDEIIQKKHFQTVSSNQRKDKFLEFAREQEKILDALSQRHTLTGFEGGYGGRTAEIANEVSSDIDSAFGSNLRGNEAAVAGLQGLMYVALPVIGITLLTVAVSGCAGTYGLNPGGADHIPGQDKVSCDQYVNGYIDANGNQHPGHVDANGNQLPGKILEDTRCKDAINAKIKEIKCKGPAAELLSLCNEKTASSVGKDLSSEPEHMVIEYDPVKIPFDLNKFRYIPTPEDPYIEGLLIGDCYSDGKDICFGVVNKPGHPDRWVAMRAQVPILKRNYDFWIGNKTDPIGMVDYQTTTPSDLKYFKNLEVYTDITHNRDVRVMRVPGLLEAVRKPDAQIALAGTTEQVDLNSL